MPSPGFVNWDVLMRQVLCCLHRFFDGSRDDMASLFQAIFNDQSISETAFMTQWYWMRSKVHGVWWHVCCEEEFRTDGIWIHHINLIRRGIHRVNFIRRLQQRPVIKLAEKEKDDTDYPTNPENVGTPKWSIDFNASVEILVR